MNEQSTIRERAARGRYDAVVIGSGPNGLAGAAMLARCGASVLVLEAGETVGGGCRTAELTIPGLKHDVCSAIHPLGLGSPFFRTLPLAEYGLSWIHPDVPLAHPFDDAPPALLCRSIADTADTLGPDAAAYRRLLGSLTPDWDELCAALLGPIKMARYPLGLARFGIPAMLSSHTLTDYVFRGGRAKALFSGLAAHSFLQLEKPFTSAIGLVLGIAGHAVGWPFARGGSQSIADALASYIVALGGEILTSSLVRSLSDLPEAKVVLCDIGPRQFDQLADGRLPAGYRRRLLAYRYGPAVFKMDWALDGPVPWTHPACARAATVHLGATRAEISMSERAIWRDDLVDRPFVLLAQQSLFDESRLPAEAPPGVGHSVQAVWAYCHVPNGYEGDATERIERQVERFAPGFRDRIVARSVLTPSDYERYNANNVGGDIGGGVFDAAQIFARPVFRPIPWETPLRGVYLCSASTPPGGGVHGMCGYYAALAALRDLR